MTRKLEHELQTVIDAVRGDGKWKQGAAITTSGGIVATVAQRLGVSRETVYKYSRRWETVKQALDDEREMMLDITENKLFAQIHKENMTAIIFYLKTQGKHRGYIERVEHDFDWRKEAEIKGIDASELFNRLVAEYMAAFKTGD